MSRAFLKNDDAQAWSPPQQAPEYALYALEGPADLTEPLRAGDDLAELLAFARQRVRGPALLRDRHGVLLARLDDSA